MPPMMNVPDESVAPSKGVPRTVTRASAISEPLAESLTDPEIVTNGPGPYERWVVGVVATVAMVARGTLTMVRASVRIR